MSLAGFVLPAASIGLGSLLLKPQRGFFIPLPEGEVGPPEPFPYQPHIVIEENHRDEIVITDHPVESGSRVSDHFYKLPAEVTIRCAWSNSPPVSGGLLGAAIGAVSAVGGSVARIAAAASSTLNAIDTIQSVLNGESANQVVSIYQKLRQLQVSGEPFDIYTGKRVYVDMLFQSLQVTTDASTENALLLVAVCRQVIFARTKIIDTTVNNDALEDEEDSEIVDQGEVSAEEVDDMDIPDPSLVDL